MTKINCKITERIQKDFNSIWRCKQRGDTIEISTPYLLPDSTLLSLFITTRTEKGVEKFIVHDGGSIFQIISENCPLPDDEIKSSLDGFSAKYGIRQCLDASKQKVFFKDCKKKSLISSIAFDLASFATTATNVLVATSVDEPNIEPDKRFQRNADSFIKTAIHSSGLKFKPRHEIKEYFPGIKFSGVINSSNRIWIVSYVTGSDLTYFRRSVAETNMNFEHVWKSRQSISNHIGRTIPLLNTDAKGYEPNKLKWQIDMLQESSKNNLVKWTDRNSIVGLLS
jgi:hypothetical protein